MQTMYPDRIVAIWLRSGTAYARWESGEIPKPEIPDSVYAIPVMCNPGAKENGDKRFSGAWDGCLAMFKAYRSHGAPIGFAPDPRTSYQCGDCRYLAIPFFDACLAMRLPGKGSVDQRLQPVNMKAAWLAAPMSEQAEPLSSYRAKADEAVWLPNETVAKAWAEYVKTGAVSDSTPPPAALNVRAARQPDQSVEVTWDAEADFESGVQAFIVQRDGKDLAQTPETPVGQVDRLARAGLDSDRTAGEGHGELALGRRGSGSKDSSRADHQSGTTNRGHTKEHSATYFGVHADAPRRRSRPGNLRAIVTSALLPENRHAGRCRLYQSKTSWLPR
jgi:hypothetical protein